MDEVRSFKAAMTDYGDFLAEVDGVPTGSAAKTGRLIPRIRGWRGRGKN